MLVSLYAQLIRGMDSVFEAYLGPDSVLAGAVGGAVGELDDIPKRNTDVWLLGKRYNAIQGETHMQYERRHASTSSHDCCTYMIQSINLPLPHLQNWSPLDVISNLACGARIVMDLCPWARCN